MKKNFIVFFTAAAMLIPTAAVFAADEPAATDASVQDVMPVSGEIDFNAPYVNPSYISNTVTVTEVADGKISATTNTEDAENPENEINFTITDKTAVFDSAKGEKKDVKDIVEGDSITVFTGVFEPTLLILPPLYTANVVVINNISIDALRFVDVDTYIERDGALVNLANTLELNLDETVEIVDLDGKTVKAEDIANKDLAVFYASSTKSVPAQTTPVTVVVLGENEKALELLANADTAPASEATQAPEEIPVDFSKITSVKIADETITNVYTNAEGNLMLPLRKIAETLGFTVEWDGNLRAVMLNSGMYSLEIGENSYVKGKMTPVELSAAPEITNDLTYVPLDYFTDILETEINLNLDENSVEFSAVNE